LLITAQLTVCTAVLVIPLAWLAAIARLSEHRLPRAVSLVYVEVFRSIPLLALLLLTYYGLGPVLVALGVSAFWAAVVALAVGEAAYLAEVYRASIQSVRKQQWDAAKSLGLSRLQSYCLVVLPQSLPSAVPPTINMVVYTVKGTALTSLITVNELMQEAEVLVSDTYEPLPIFMLAGLLYLSLTIPLGALGQYVESRIGRSLGLRGWLI
jgi:His/Glu/Gln/Arg/opine family amino acid ABC transporter permease subunit